MSAESQKAAIDVRSTSKIYGKRREDGVVALDDVSLLIHDNEFFTLLGPSGCGKTTLLRLIAGFEQPTQGEILLFDQHLEGLPPYKRPVNTVFQHYALFPHMTVTENIAFGLEMLGRPESEIHNTVKEVLALVQMEHLANRKTSEISGGQQQRVALARALAPRPKVLLLDEPLSALDFKLRKEMQLELKRLQLDTGITFVFVTHDQEEALTMSDRVAVMSAGKILQVGSPKEIYDHPARRFVADFIGDINILRADFLGADQDRAKIRFASGFETTASMPEQSDQLSGNVSIAVRPEQVEFIEDQENAAFHCTIGRITYFGSGSHYDLETSSGEVITLRQQNRLSDNRSFEVGDKVNIALNEASLQVLTD